MKSIVLPKKEVDEIKTSLKLQRRAGTLKYDPDLMALSYIGKLAYVKMFCNDIEIIDNITEAITDKIKDCEILIKTTSYVYEPHLRLSRLPVNCSTKNLVMAICDYETNPYKVFLSGEISPQTFLAHVKMKCWRDHEGVFKKFFYVNEKVLNRHY